LSVTGTTYLASTLGVQGNTDITGGLGVTGAATLRSTLGVTGAATLSSTLNVSGVSYFATNVGTGGNLDVIGGLGVTGAVTLRSTLAVTGAVTFTTALPVTSGGTGTATGSISGTGALTFTAGGTNTNINLVPNGNGTVDVSSKRITSLATPTLSTDAATKAYVDQIAQGINYHEHVEAATTAGLGATYQNGVNGVGATLQASPSAGWSTSYADGVTLTVGDRFLVKNQSGSGVTVQNVFILFLS
jgi:hypothetical protein